MHANHKALASLVAVLLLAPVMAHANKAHEMLSQMSDAKRNSALTTIMERSGERCNVTKTFFQGFDQERNTFWSVRCSNKKAFSVMIRDDASGSTKILECSILKAVAKVDCFKKF